MISGKARWYVVVLDDRREFALHVWRYLNRSLGIDTAPAGGTGEAWISEGEVRPFLDGVNCFCWIHADSHWEESLKPILGEVERGWNLMAIVDVVGAGGSRYDPAAVLECLRKYPENIHWRLVSAYHIGTHIAGNAEVLPKSRSTLHEIRRQLYAGVSGGRELPNATHILITGAGFEIKNSLGGFGMLATTQLLERMGSPFQLMKAGEEAKDASLTYLEPSKEGFPCPVGKIFNGLKSIEMAANKRDLDSFWDILLKAELDTALVQISEWDDSDREKIISKALLSERRMREAFRLSIQEHDWGHMNQSLAAATLDWHAWFTTNYTRFADRAIALMDPEAWKIISTAAEANISIREDNWILKDSEKGNVRSRYLFKLHGDVGHLHTMAIAGHDKDTFSPLSVPVDDLYQVYASAERFLRYSLKGSSGPLIWHIVGHALGDRRLVNLILHACEQAEKKSLFLVVDKKPGVPADILRAAFAKKDGGAVAKLRIETQQFLAEEYIARVAFSGLPPSADLKSVAQWFVDLPPGELARKGGKATRRKKV